MLPYTSLPQKLQPGFWLAQGIPVLVGARVFHLKVR